MKKKLLITIAVATSINCIAQNNPQVFYGGSGDGFSKQSYAQSSINTMFNGNAGDGWSRNSYAQQGGASQFFGGNGDGWNKNNYSQASIGTMFTGGNGDGWNLNNYAQQGSNQQFFGGNGDGWNTNNYNQTHFDFAYKGGAGDGWASNYTPLLPLPITFLKFDAYKEERTSHLKWLLAKDDEVQSFDVERSHNAVSFEKIGNVAQNDANKKSYGFVDRQPMTGSNYYRLKVINKDGTTEYTGTKVVKFDDAKSIAVKIYPNPATNVVNIELPEDVNNETNLILNIYGMNGAMVHHQKISKANSSIITVNTEKFAVGNYVVHLRSENVNATGKVVVVKE